MATKTKKYNTSLSLPFIASNLEKAHYKITSMQDTKMELNTPPSSRSWGEKITIELQAEGSYSLVTITSHSKYQLVDWGKSNENIEKIFSLIDNLEPEN